MECVDLNNIEWEKWTDSTLMDKLIILSQDEALKYFLEESYSLELLLRLLKYQGIDGIENLYNSIVSGKPKQPAFDRYLKRLENFNLIRKERSSDKRVWGVYLTDFCIQRLHFSKLTFRDMSPTLVKSIDESFTYSSRKSMSSNFTM
tara:strand:- start:208 stop:648 length:441 start_codon:yes stop_codon:yes gene_type:complete